MELQKGIVESMLNIDLGGLWKVLNATFSILPVDIHLILSNFICQALCWVLSMK